MTQLTHDQNEFTARSFPIGLLTDGVRSPANIGGLLRLMDAFGIKDLYLGNADIDLSSSRLKRTARGTERNLNVNHYDTALQAVVNIKKEQPQVQFLGLEITSKSTILDAFKADANAQYVLVLGGEINGISPDVLEQCLHVFHIPMYGHNSSMNVTQSAAIALYTLTQKLL